MYHSLTSYDTGVRIHPSVSSRCNDQIQGLPFPVAVFCGNGGDYGFEVDRHRWKVYLEKANTKHFAIVPHDQSDMAVIFFRNEADATWFALAKPEYPPLC